MPEKNQGFVCVVDDDESVREALPDLLGEFGFASSGFASAEEFLASPAVHQAECLILDVAMPGMTGPELHLELMRRGHTTPIVFITAYAEEGLLPRLIAQGAAACLFKPFSDIDLRDAVRVAIASRKGQGAAASASPPS